MKTANKKKLETKMKFILALGLIAISVYAETCECRGGQPADDCAVAGEQKCVSCDAGFKFLKRKNKCNKIKERPCRCENGTPADNCSKKRRVGCESCHAGYEVSKRGTCKKVELHESFAHLESWGNAVKGGLVNKAAVLEHYVEGASLWPTLSNDLRQKRDDMGSYFDMFLAKIAEEDAYVNWNLNHFQVIKRDLVNWSGQYTFGLSSGPAAARYTYLLQKINGNWKILHHHSSLLPEN